jgi:hypothetical protein
MQVFNTEQPAFDFSVALTHAEKFEEFHKQNPQVLVMLEQLANEMISRGRRRVGIGLLCEVLRWNYYMQTDEPNSEFKLNNNYRPHYARLLIERHPNWADVFETRNLRSA